MLTHSVTQVHTFVTSLKQLTLTTKSEVLQNCKYLAAGTDDNCYNGCLTYFILKLVQSSCSQFLIISTKSICQH